jgi:hypothetical protein
MVIHLIFSSPTTPRLPERKEKGVSSGIKETF